VLRTHIDENSYWFCIKIGKQQGDVLEAKIREEIVLYQTENMLQNVNYLSIKISCLNILAIICQTAYFIYRHHIDTKATFPSSVVLHRGMAGY
jgi:hypothetical protein